MKKFIVILATATLALSTMAFAENNANEAMQPAAAAKETVVADASSSTKPEAMTTGTEKKAVKHHAKKHKKHCNCHEKGEKGAKSEKSEKMDSDKMEGEKTGM